MPRITAAELTVHTAILITKCYQLTISDNELVIHISVADQLAVLPTSVSAWEQNASLEKAVDQL